jgi:hypothetical protein
MNLTTAGQPIQTGAPMKTPERTIKEWLKVIARRREFSAYTEGIRLFVRSIDEKSPEQLTRVCWQIKDVILSNPQLAVDLFGIGAVNFFEAMDMNNIIWAKKNY